MGFCYQKNFSNPTLPVDEAQFWVLVKAEKWNENIDKYRETGDAALKAASMDTCLSSTAKTMNSEYLADTGVKID